MNDIIYTKPAVGPIALSCAYIDENLANLGCFRTQAYITKDLLVVEIRGLIWDLPDFVHCRFPSEDQPQHPRQAYRLTNNLFDKVLRNVARVEDAWVSGNRGSLTPIEYDIMQRRTAIIVEAFERLPRFVSSTEL